MELAKGPNDACTPCGGSSSPKEILLAKCSCTVPAPVLAASTAAWASAIHVDGDEPPTDARVRQAAYVFHCRWFCRTPTSPAVSKERETQHVVARFDRWSLISGTARRCYR